ncbi:hypothetical protein M514_04378 [Trichuris suis]|uniref:Tc1-like transposase DDE domain-containing protein n=1 Tax=Trichuris suis TaxID=68888 RepID=A0A085N4I5_9BILA|nr:hypothetical protein M514_04378 [Trichuris suis]
MEDPGDERLEQRAVIKFLFREGVSGNEIHQRLVKVYKDDALSYSQLREEIKEKRRRKLSRKVLLLHDNAPVHRAKVALAAIQQCGFGQIDHPPYSPDLAPSDYFLFGNLKQHLRGTVFSDDNELKSAVQDYFNSREKNFFFNGLMNLKSRCEKCIEVEGQYI